jgi:hypothetical protein
MLNVDLLIFYSIFLVQVIPIQGAKCIIIVCQNRNFLVVPIIKDFPPNNEKYAIYKRLLLVFKFFSGRFYLSYMQELLFKLKNWNGEVLYQATCMHKILADWLIVLWNDITWIWTCLF